MLVIEGEKAVLLRSRRRVFQPKRIILKMEAVRFFETLRVYQPTYVASSKDNQPGDAGSTTLGGLVVCSVTLS